MYQRSMYLHYFYPHLYRNCHILFDRRRHYESFVSLISVEWFGIGAGKSIAQTALVTDNERLYMTLVQGTTIFVESVM